MKNLLTKGRIENQKTILLIFAVMILVCGIQGIGYAQPTFSQDSTTRSIAENTSAGTDIGAEITALNANAYRLGGQDAVSFRVKHVSGNAVLQTHAPLDFETKNTYNVTLFATDNTGNSDSISVAINVTNVNEAPVFDDGTSTTRSIAENTAPNQNIGDPVTAADPDIAGSNTDANPGTATSNALTYSLGGTEAASFSIVGSSGQLQTNATLNSENKNSYEVTVTVTDSSKSSTIDVTINVENVNEFAPVFIEGNDPITRSVVENTPIGVGIGLPVVATDADGDTLIYALGGTQSEIALFTIDATTGQLRTYGTLNYENKDSYNDIFVRVIDRRHDPQKSDRIDISIKVININEPPVFTKGDDITFSVDENTIGDIGTPLTATDGDGHSLVYSLSGADAASFDVDRETGQLKTKEDVVLNYESGKTTYTVTVIASDGEALAEDIDGGNFPAHTPIRTDTITVTITLNDVNDPPMFNEELTTEYSVQENEPIGTLIGDPLTATDEDGDTLTYSIHAEVVSPFEIDSETG